MTTPRLAIARADYAPIDLYAPDRRPCRIDLSDNTNLWGPPPAAAARLRGAGADAFTRYPDLYARRLKAAIAARFDVAPDMVVTGCGSDDVLDSAIRAFARPGGVVVTADPSFAMIPLFARMNGLASVSVPLDDAYAFDPRAYLDAGPGIAYLCAPNNPTGTPLPRAVIDAVVDGFDGLVIIDEAYADFAGTNALDLARSRDNVLVARTMSKAYGLAALRIGFGIGSPALVAEVEKSRGPYKVSAVAEDAAVAALTEDAGWVDEHVALAIENRERLIETLDARGFEPVPSRSNFVLVPLRGAVAIAGAMRAGGVAVRPFADLPTSIARFGASGGEGIRISVGPWTLLEEAIDLLTRSRDAHHAV